MRSMRVSLSCYISQSPLESFWDGFVEDIVGMNQRPVTLCMFSEGSVADCDDSQHVPKRTWFALIDICSHSEVSF